MHDLSRPSHPASRKPGHHCNVYLRSLGSNRESNLQLWWNAGQNSQLRLVFDSAGNLYGTTQSGGLNNAGIVFQLHKTISGIWIENILYNFTGLADGGTPLAGLIFDSAGNLYGTTSKGGSIGRGTVFELTPNGLGGYTESVLYSFASGSDGATPSAKVVFDSAGNLYGTTSTGGTGSVGTVFELSPSGSGWTETVLHSFSGTDGSTPLGELVLDASGNLYGTTFTGGSQNVGTVFELIQSSGWTESVLHDFKQCTFNCFDGQKPAGGLIFSGPNLLGTTTAGGGTGLGTVFELINHVTSYTETSYGFYRTTGGSLPIGTLTYNGATNTFYGTTEFLPSFGGGSGSGTVFAVQVGGSSPISTASMVESTSTPLMMANSLKGVSFSTAPAIFMDRLRKAAPAPAARFS